MKTNRKLFRTLLSLSASFLVAFAIALSLPSDVSAQTSWNQSYSTCYAYTTCPVWGYGYYGPQIVGYQPISCQVHGQSYGPGAQGTACSWVVYPNQAVGCKGYVSTPYGEAWQNYWYECP